jgi:hypothetical protein
MLKMEENLMVHPFQRRRWLEGQEKCIFMVFFRVFFKMEVHQNNKKCSPFQREKEVGGKE